VFFHLFFGQFFSLIFRAYFFIDSPVFIIRIGAYGIGFFFEMQIIFV